MFHRGTLAVLAGVLSQFVGYTVGFQVSPTRWALGSSCPTSQLCGLRNNDGSSAIDRNGALRRVPSSLFSTDDDNVVNVEDEARSVITLDSTSTDSDIWAPSMRKIIAALSTIGMVETGYLSYIKLFVPDGISKICGSADSGSLSSCSSVLNSPYATIQIGDIDLPLTAIGFVAYGAVTGLSVLPLVAGGMNDRNENNRIAILGSVTAMATFSSFLLSLLFNTLHQSCPYCLLSAALSISMGFLAWTSGALPINRRQDGVKLGVGSFLTTTIAALGLFLSVDEVAMQSYSSGLMQANGLSSNVVAQANEPKKNIPPPPITSTSSDRALKIGEDLKSLDAKLYGAYWCSHCFEQKQRLGKEAFANVDYIECSAEGLNSQKNICKEKKIPGYPTWELSGKLYPGEVYLDELEDMIKDVRKDI